MVRPRIKGYQVRSSVLALLDGACLASACYLGLAVRYLDSSLPDDIRGCLPALVVAAAVMGVPIFRWLRVYRIHASYMGTHEVARIAKAVSLVTLAFAAYTRIGQWPNYSRGALIVFWFFALLMTVGYRLAYRMPGALRRARLSIIRPRRVLILGAGDTGETVLRQIVRSAPHTHRVVGFLDDDPAKQGLEIHGVRILGSCDTLAAAVQDYRVDEVIIAMPSADGSRVRRLLRECELLRVRLEMAPGLNHAHPRGVNMGQFARPVQPEDLLNREPVRVDMQEIAAYLTGKRVLVTGAGGSIGSELARQIVPFRPERLVLLGRGEGSIFAIDRELREELGADPEVVIADVTDADRIRRVFVRHRPQVVFHAAAHKHVPLMEANPEEAVKNNVFGTKNLVDLSAEYRVECFTLISTDKAVNPTSVMGATKRVAEMIVQAAAANSPQGRFVAVRFGNVLGSRGSVVPTIQKQIARGGPVTVTHPEMVRYFMTIPEAVQLVIQAAGIGEGGGVFVLDMGEPIKILDLAKDLIRLSGFVPDEEIRIQFIGVRPGEKLFEEPLTSHEGTVATRHDRIFVAPLGHSLPADLNRRLQHLGLVAAAGDGEGIRKALKELVPSYTPWTPAKQATK